jgi:hypothetical protein
LLSLLRGWSLFLQGLLVMTEFGFHPCPWKRLCGLKLLHMIAIIKTRVCWIGSSLYQLDHDFRLHFPAKLVNRLPSVPD